MVRGSKSYTMILHQKYPNNGGDNTNGENTGGVGN